MHACFFHVSKSSKPALNDVEIVDNGDEMRIMPNRMTSLALVDGNGESRSRPRRRDTDEGRDRVASEPSRSKCRRHLSLPTSYEGQSAVDYPSSASSSAFAF
jgi:hypothetical protein